MVSEVTPHVDAHSAAQTKQRQIFGRSSSAYGALTAVQVEAWRQYAAGLTWVDKKSGAKYVPDAIQAYNALADRWLAANNNVGTPPVAPPQTTYVGDALSITASASASKVNFSSTAATSTSTVVELWLQRLPKATRLPRKNGYRVVGYATFTASAPGNVFSVTVTPGAYAAMYRFVDKSTGLATPLVRIPVSGLALGLEQGGADEEAERQAA